MEQLLDFNGQDKPLNIQLLEQVVYSLNTSADARGQADKVLTALKEHPNAWQQAGKILEESNDAATKVYGLSILEDAIKYRWKVLPAEQREGIRNYVVKKIIDLASSDDYGKPGGQKLFVNKLNLVLVQILKQEWPHNWPNFITEIVGSSKQSEVLCENNMIILKYLSEEVFDFSKEEMTTAKVTEMKTRLNAEFRQIFDLCQLVLTSSTRPSLVKVTLQTLLRFLAWIPLGYIFETPLVEQLMTRYLPDTKFRNDTLACLTEIASLKEPQYDPVFMNLFLGVMNLLARQLPPDTDIAAEYENASSDDCDFIRNLALFFVSYFSNHLNILEKPENQHQCLTAFTYLVAISRVDDEEIFKICLDFWNKFARDLFDGERQQQKAAFSSTMNTGVLNLGGSMNTYLQPTYNSPRKQLYGRILSQLRSVMISSMAKPEEVILVEDDDGTIIRETDKDTATIAQYKTMRDTLVFLTHLDYEDTEQIMLTGLHAQCTSPKGFSWNQLSTLCWAIGSISGAMAEEREKRFLVTVIKDLLELTESTSGKDNKAVVAGNIMYVVGQYPRFLRNHWRFLKTVVKKLFEFMHETHPGVQDMACDTFLKISQKCKAQFVQLQRADEVPFINDLLDSIVQTTRDLSANQRHTFYEAVGHMVKEQENESIRNNLLERLMQPCTVEWKKRMQMGSQNPQTLSELQNIKDICDILRLNARVCNSMGYAFRPHMMTFYLDMLHVYSFYSGNIQQRIREAGPMGVQHVDVKLMRKAKTDVLRLIETFVSKSENPQDIADNFVPPLLEPVLGDYQQGAAVARDHEVLQLFATTVNKLKNQVNVSMNGQMVEKILAPVFNPTLEMITQNFIDNPEHRVSFYKLLKALNQYCFERLFSVPDQTQKDIINAIIWGFKHTDRVIAEMSLEILERLLNNVANAPDQFAQKFYSQYFLSLLQDVLYVLTDRLHKSGFTMHATILRHMFGQVSNGRIQVPLGPNVTDNQQFLHGYTSDMIAKAFPNVGPKLASEFVMGLLDPHKDYHSFKTHLRDFLIQLKEFSGDEDVDKLFLLDKEEEKKRMQQQNLQQRAAVPGLLTQQEQDEMAEL